MGVNLAALMDALADAMPDREAIIFRDKTFTYRELSARSSRLANYLKAHGGLRTPTPRDQLENWQSGQDHIALYMYNGNEYPESIIGTLKARAVPVNINYRYVEEELLHVMQDADIRVLIYHGCFADKVTALRDHMPDLKLLIQVDEGSGAALLPGAISYEDALAAAEPTPPADLSPDDLYMIYTGGTTGMPKGVLWRQGDFNAAMLGAKEKDGTPTPDIETLVRRAKRNPPVRSLAAAPYMHGSGQLVSFVAWLNGNTVVLLDKVQRFDAAEMLYIAARHDVNTIGLVGDAFARVIADELEAGDYHLPHLRLLVSAGAIFSRSVKDRIIKILPDVSVFDAFGSTESGPQSVNVTSRDTKSDDQNFKFTHNGIALNAGKNGFLTVGEDEPGWFAATGTIPLGYLNDREKTEKTFPTVRGTRYSVPGDRVRLREDGSMEFLGRDSVTINSGGEKIYAEEVERAVLHHPGVFDTVVSSRPNDRFGAEVVAIVELRHGANATEDALNTTAGKHIARYKLPRAYLFVDKVRRGQNGKADYRWAKELAEASLTS